ncbi:tetratricopeptide repeat protein [Pseudaestuariivita sp.]|uniref:tetratricopeptide repeat protein n=1 Tax=Pseudaestuariivita sp. TaxID=2211669 RepID=UPI004058A0AC
MTTDLFGYALTLSNPKAGTHWDALVRAFLAHSAEAPTHLASALEAEPDFAMAHAAKGLFTLLLGRRELVPVARDALAAAEAAARRTQPSAREMAFVHALSAYLRDTPSEAVAEMERVLAAHPRDTFALKVGHAIRFVLGDNAGMRRSIERVMPAYDADHPARGYLLGCHAFALEETGDYAKAETAGRMGLSLAADDAWGLHAVAHVHDMTGNAQAGLDWLTGREAAWAHCNNFRYHVWWHKALMHLDLGDTEAVLALYDAEIRADKTDDYRDISNATSLLSRLELDGVDVGTRWEELAALSAERTEDGCLIFADLHYMLALIGGRREDAARDMLRRLSADARRTHPTEIEARMAKPGLHIATGLEAFGEADYRTAFLNLARGRQSLQAAGGSHAQRDVFERLTIDAGIRAGFVAEAEAILAERTAKRAGREDGYAAARREMIAAAQSWASPEQLPAE